MEICCPVGVLSVGLAGVAGIEVGGAEMVAPDEGPASPVLLLCV